MYKNILNLMVNGVSIDGEIKRPFDIIDYFSLTQESYEEFYEKAKNIMTHKEEIYFEIFCSINSFDKSLNLNNPDDLKIFKEIINGNKEINEKTKPLLIDFLIENNVPLCTKSIRAVQKRFLNGTLKLSGDSITKKLILNK